MPAEASFATIYVAAQVRLAQLAAVLLQQELADLDPSAVELALLDLHFGLEEAARLPTGEDQTAILAELVETYGLLVVGTDPFLRPGLAYLGDVPAPITTPHNSLAGLQRAGTGSGYYHLGADLAEQVAGQAAVNQDLQTAAATAQAAATAAQGAANGAQATGNTAQSTANGAQASANTNAASLALKAPINNPSLMGAATSPTPAADSNNTLIATTAWVVAYATAAVSAAIGNLVGSAPAALDTVYELAAAVGNNTSTLSALLTNVAGRLSIASNLADLASASAARANLGLGNVTNTSDPNKPVSTAQAAAIKVAATTLPLATSVSAAYTLALTDAGSLLEATGSTDFTITIPTDAAVAFAIGTVIEIAIEGTGIVTIAGASGVTLTAYAAGYKSSGQYTSLYLRKRAANAWRITGGVA